MDKPERIAQHIAHKGIASRREAEKWISNGRVAVNGKKVKDLSTKINYSDKVYLDGDLLNFFITPRLVLFNKPKGVMSTHKDTKDRPIIFDFLPRKLMTKKSGILKYIGRLDFNSQGLMLLTNDIKLKTFLEKPQIKIKRKYKVKVRGLVENEIIHKIRDGIIFQGIKYKPYKINIISKSRSNTWLDIVLTEGKNREIRKLLSRYRLFISKLIRTEYGPYKLSNLETGKYKEVSIIKNSKYHY